MSLLDHALAIFLYCIYSSWLGAYSEELYICMHFQFIMSAKSQDNPIMGLMCRWFPAPRGYTRCLSIRVCILRIEPQRNLHYNYTLSVNALKMTNCNNVPFLQRHCRDSSKWRQHTVLVRYTYKPHYRHPQLAMTAMRTPTQLWSIFGMTALMYVSMYTRSVCEQKYNAWGRHVALWDYSYH